MTGFGTSPKTKKTTKQDTSKLRAEEGIKQSIIEYQQGNLEGAKIALEKVLQADHANSFALGFLATIEKAIGNNERALKLFKRSPVFCFRYLAFSKKIFKKQPIPRKHVKKWTQTGTAVVFCSDCCLLFKKRVREAGCPGASGLGHSSS